MKLQVKPIALSILAFILVFYFYGLTTFFGYRDFLQPGPITEYMNKGFWHFEILIQASVFGFLFVVINTLTDSRHISRRSFGFLIIIRSLLYFLALALGGMAVVNVFILTDLVTWEEFRSYRDILNPGFVFSVLLFNAFFIVLLNFLFQIDKKFGPGGLWSLITGKYRQPKDEELIFLFIDLKSSTRLAEKLGHQRYSRFLKDCIHELTPIIIRNQARVHQYVGDEVVLFWPRRLGLKNKNCLRTYFEFRRRLHELRTYFDRAYGEVPFFKAGMDAGEVTITEIGDIKREIAYHGDVVNTASRLEKKCNEFGKDILISENLLKHLEGSNTYQYELVSDLPLRGKSNNLKFFAVNPN